VAAGQLAGDARAQARDQLRNNPLFEPDTIEDSDADSRAMNENDDEN